MEVLRFGYRIPFLCDPPLSKAPISMPSYHPLSTKGVTLGEVTQAFIAKTAVELAPLPSLGFYSRLFVVLKTSGSWRPVIDLSTLNLFVDVSHFRMETIQSVLLSVRQGDWMAFIDLKEAYLQVPVHPDSRRFLQFVAQGRVHQFSALCFGLSTAPQVFSRVMAPVSAILHFWGIRMRRYLDDWLVQSSSRESLLHDLRVVLDLCHELGIVVNPEKSRLKPSQVLRYLGVVIDTRSFRASPSPDRIARLKSTAWRISVLRRSSSQYLALASRHALLTLPSSSGRTPSSEVPPALSPQILGSRGSVGQDPLVSGLPQGSSVVASPSPSIVRGVSAASLSRSGLLVRRLRRGLGSSLRFTHRFQPLESGSKHALYKRQGASSHPRGSPPLPVFSGREECVSVLRQQHSSVVSPQGRRHQVSIPQLCDSRDSALGRIPLDPPVTPVHPGVSKCAGGLSLSPSPASTYREVPSSGGFSVFKSSVAGPNRLICNISQSPMFSLFLSLPGADGCEHRRLPPELGQSSGLRISSVVSHSTSASEAPGVSGDGAHLSGPAILLLGLGLCFNPLR